MKTILLGRQPHNGRRGFTILEVLVASTVLILILGVVLSIISQTSTVTRRATDKISSFQAARAAFDLISQNLSQATLNSYWDYDNPNAPTKYLRKSELHFLIGNAGIAPFGGTAGTGQAVYFQAPSGVTAIPATYGGLEALLNAVGYFISYGDEDSLPSPFPAPSPKYRYRLMQAVQPTENLAVYSSTTGNAWVSSANALAVPVAENIVYMAAWPRKSPADDAEGSALTSNFSYDSRLNATISPQPETANQMPPVIQVTIVAIDETSAARICTDPSVPAKISSAVSGLFLASSKTQFDADLVLLENRLGGSGINYRVFTAMVPIRESKMQ